MKGMLSVSIGICPHCVGSMKRINPLTFAFFLNDPLLSNKVAKIRNRYNQVPHLTQDTNGKVTNSQKTPQTRAKRSALSQQL